MGRFINHEQGFAFEDNEGYTIPLNQSNFWVWLHRDERLKDLAQVLDDRDNRPWSWFRYDQGDETFDQVDMMARKVGRVVLASTAEPEITQMFNEQHQIDTDEIQSFLDGLNDEPRD